MTRITILCALALFLFSGTEGVRLPTLIDSFMVLPREPLQARVWGWSSSSSVAVQLDGKSLGTATPNATNNGTWAFDLPQQPTSPGPHTLTFSDSNNTITKTNIAFGDVYLCSGQSNMEFSVNDAFNASEEIADSINYPNLRLFTVQKIVSDVPLTDCTSKSNYTWAPSMPSSFTPAGGPAFSWFSATCYFFGRDLYKSFDGKVPIGLVASDWGGQTVEAFSSPDALADTTCGGTVKPYTRQPYSAMRSLLPTQQPSGNEDRSSIDSMSNSPEPNPGPTQLWYGMIYPLLPMRFTGATWYQGEANAGNPDSYACRFPSMITDWRQKFVLPNLSFSFVQLAAYSADYSLIRQAQMAATKLENVGYALAIDIGDPTSPEGNIHPRRKQEVGRRLSLAVRAVQYGQTVQWRGPQLQDYKVVVDNEGNVTVTFTFTNSSGLHASGTAACVACCNESPFVVGDGVHSGRANFTIVDDHTVVAKTNLPNSGPEYVVQYDFEGYPQCALYNGQGGPDDHEGLPANPFTTPLPPPINYTLVFRQTWPFLFKDKQWNLNADDPSNDNYAILDQLESFRTPGSKTFNFLMQWPQTIGAQHWQQTSNPVTTTNRTVTGYKAIAVNSTTDGWGGLRYNNKECLLDGSVGESANTWFYAVGSFQAWTGGIPAYDNTAVPKTELYCLSPANKWVLVFRQSLPFFVSAGEFSVNPDKPTNPLYSVLDKLEELCRLPSGAFEFKLQWPEYNTWSQSSNPQLSEGAGKVTGYAPMDVRHTENSFGGLEGNVNGVTLMDGSTIPGNWDYAVGEIHPFIDNGIPGWSGPQRVVELYVMDKE